MKFNVNSRKTGSRVLEITTGELPSETKFYVLVIPNEQNLKI